MTIFITLSPNLKTFLYSHRVSDTVISRLLIKFRPLLGHLSLRGCSQLTQDSLKYIGRIQHHYYAVVLSVILSLSLSLTHRSMSESSRFKFIRMQWSQCKLVSLFPHINTLMHLSQDEVIDLVAKGCSGLLYLNLSNCFVTDSIIRTLTKYISIKFLSCPFQCLPPLLSGTVSVSTTSAWPTPLTSQPKV